MAAMSHAPAPHHQQQVTSVGGGGNNGDRHVVHWFRKGLRLHDQPALRMGLQGARTCRCVYILDPWFAGSSNAGVNKWRFLLQSLEDLDARLRKLNSRLFVIRGQPADVFPKLFKEWRVTHLTFEQDPEPYGAIRDQKITALAHEMGVSVVCEPSHTLYPLERILERHGGKTPLTYRQFQGVVVDMEPPAQPLPAPETLPRTPIDEDHDERFAVPTLAELGFDMDNLKAAVWPGGETEALARLERHMERKQAWVASFGSPRMTPKALLASQTGLSPYLRFGCLSARLFYHQLADLYRKIPWDVNAEALAKWANGQTGYPWIDAIMRQLREEGWIHHVARHAVACFLTRGDLWLSWEEGMKVFDELLLDADWSVNAGSWMWLSCSSFFQQFFHVYCPVRFGRKADPSGDYIRKYVPVLKHFPNNYIHEPWTAPESVQVAARCVVGRDYPLPMVNHQVASHINLQRIQQVYQQLTQCVKAPGLFPSLPSASPTECNKQNNHFINDRKLRTKNSRQEDEEESMEGVV
ncbi:cryptochrome-1-like isoform X5 [Dermacentor andersoni]|uniref:cryptochrome-1-like isoform X5 n=1 Tax=Dermacentor andersoni TaxID=34620 RepID=UPI003B3A4D26